MEIIITWTQLLAVLFFYFFYRYLAGCIKKMCIGAESPFDPFVPFENVCAHEAWRQGFNYGQKKLRKKYLKYLEKIKSETLKLSDAFDTYFNKKAKEDAEELEK